MGGVTDIRSASPVLPEKQAWRALAALCIGFFMILLDQTVVAVATPQFQTELGASLNAVVWVTSIYLITFAVPLLVTGRLGDRYGQRNVYLVGMIIFTLSSLACGLAPSIEWLIAARAVQGLGASILTPQTMSVINRIFARERRGAAMGIWGAVAGFASLAGPLLGGLITGTLGWQWIFFINIPFGVLSLVMVAKWVPTMEKTTRQVDVLSVVLSLFAVFGVVYAMQQGPKLNWPGWIWIVFFGGIISMLLFLWRQHTAGEQGTDPLIPLGIFRNRNFSIGAFSIATMGFAVASIALPMMIYLQNGLGMSAEKAGLMLVPTAVISGVLSPFVGRLADRVHPRTLSMIGFGAMTVAVGVLAAVMRDGISVWWLLLPILLMGVGHGFIWSPNSATAMRDLSLHRLGAASGVYNTTRQVGSVVGAAAVGAAMQIGAAKTSLGNAMGNAVIITACVLFLGFVSVSFFRSSSERASGGKAD
ncbi:MULTISPECIES: DHA2 family efflux MFS transporter permease subunit [unclassified Corynebacterium]|uniref:DHA2 family efflux MFS transporter permease subunit n=1 Tax=unclassified Corynebacterium TaxID=2624378 RepID=UPI003524B2E5